jgi:hypothetical protein
VTSDVHILFCEFSKLAENGTSDAQLHRTRNFVGHLWTIRDTAVSPVLPVLTLTQWVPFYTEKVSCRDAPEPVVHETIRRMEAGAKSRFIIESKKKR